MREKRPNVPLGPVLARRVFGVVGDNRRKIVLTFGQPRAIPGSDWSCPVRIQGLPGVRSVPRTIFGIDALQALELAVEYARVNLWKAAPRLTWLGQRGDLGLPGWIPSYLPRGVQNRIEAAVRRESLRFWRRKRKKRTRKADG